MDSYKRETIRRLRIDHEELRGYMDDEIESAYSQYSTQTRGVDWMVGLGAEFVRWATQSPLEVAKGK